MELTLPNNYDIELLTDEIANRVEKLNLVVVDPTNPKKCDDLRTSTNKWVREITEALDNFVMEYSKPAREYVKKYEDLLNPLQVALIDLSERILLAKKEQFKNKVYEKYMYLLQTSDDGVIIPFDVIYEESWYGKSEKVWFSALCEKMRKQNKKNEVVDTYLRVITSKDKYEDLINYLKKNLIGYEEV